MIRHLVVHYAPLVAICIVSIYALVKLVVIRSFRLREDPLNLFINSFRIYSKQEIKNTFHSDLRRYLRYSNSINKFFYIMLVCIGMVYILCLN